MRELMDYLVIKYKERYSKIIQKADEARKVVSKMTILS